MWGTYLGCGGDGNWDAPEHLESFLRAQAGECEYLLRLGGDGNRDTPHLELRL